jgi:hypothetical protein
VGIKDEDDAMTAVKKLPDTILYTVVTEPGGVDGMDHHDKGGVIILTTFDLEEATKKVGLDSRLKVEKQIVCEDDVRAALAKLDPIERFLIQQHFAAATKAPAYRDITGPRPAGVY